MLEVGVGMLGLLPDEFWSITPQEMAWKLNGFQMLEENRLEKLMASSYYAGYGIAPISKGSTKMKLDKFIYSFVSEKRKTELHKAKIERIKNLNKKRD